jgi:predicted nucleic acid-binding protein
MAEIESWPTAICDAGPLIHLDEIGCLDLLADFQALVVPEQVWEEVTHHRPSVLEAQFPAFHRAPVAIASDPRFRALVKSFSLDIGEQAALSLMSDQPEAVLLTDDAAARLAAQALGLRTHGSIGVLLRSVRLGRRKRSDVLSILRGLPACSTLHIRWSLLQEIIERVESWPEGS